MVVQSSPSTSGDASKKMVEMAKYIADRLAGIEKQLTAQNANLKEIADQIAKHNR